MKSPPPSATLLALGLAFAMPLAAQPRDASDGSERDHPVTYSGQTGSDVQPASPTDSAGRPIDRGSGENPNRINSDSRNVNADNSRPQVDAMGSGAAGSTQHQQVKRAGEVFGREVKAANGDKLGDVRDFVVDTETGRIVYGVVNSGGILGIGGVRRPVPFEALQPSQSPEEDALILNIEKEQWVNAPVFRDEELASLSRENQGQQIHQYFGVTWEAPRSDLARTDPAPRAAAPPPRSEEGSGQAGKSAEPEMAADAPPAGPALVLATQLDGRDLLGAGAKLGEVEDVVIDSDRRHAALLIDMEESVGPADTYVIGFDRVSLSGSGSEVSLMTELTRADFENVTATSGDLASGQPYAWTEGQETETDAAAGITYSGAGTATSADVRFSDATSNPQNRPIGSSPGDRQVEGARARVADVQQALREDPALAEAAAGIEVSARGESLVLSGTVASEDARQRVVNAARSAASGQLIDDQIRVGGAAE